MGEVACLCGLGVGVGGSLEVFGREFARFVRRTSRITGLSGRLDIYLSTYLFKMLWGPLAIDGGGEGKNSHM